MKLCFFRWFNISIVPTVIVSLVMSQMVYAQAPVVTGAELKQAIANSAKARKENLDQVRGFFSGDVARKALTLAKLDSDRVQKAVSALDANELAKLAAQTKQIQSDFAAGDLMNQ